ncbi:MAG: hypothetical protein M3N18_13915 [Actinomycetota bacterium]|nr:hypothetical protein [Actinomycetota bacterium]
MPKKVRDEEDFRELGAYLRAAYDALVRARIKSGAMYRSGEGMTGEIEDLQRSVFGLRIELNKVSRDDLNGARVLGPEPFGVQYESLDAISKALSKMPKEAELSRAEDRQRGERGEQ